MFYDKKTANLISNFLINVSSAYFMAAALTPTAAIEDIRSKFVNFYLNIIAAIMYFILAVKMNRPYE